MCSISEIRDVPKRPYLLELLKSPDRSMESILLEYANARYNGIDPDQLVYGDPESAQPRGVINVKRKPNR